MTKEQKVVKVDMCVNYFWAGRPGCAQGLRASIKCHSQRPDCPQYEQGEHYPQIRRKS